MQMVAVFKTYRLIPHTMVYNDIEWYILVEFHSGVMESLFRSNRSVAQPLIELSLKNKLNYNS